MTMLLRKRFAHLGKLPTNIDKTVIFLLVAGVVCLQLLQEDQLLATIVGGVLVAWEIVQLAPWVERICQVSDSAQARIAEVAMLADGWLALDERARVVRNYLGPRSE